MGYAINHVARPMTLTSPPVGFAIRCAAAHRIAKQAAGAAHYRFVGFHARFQGRVSKNASIYRILPSIEKFFIFVHSILAFHPESFMFAVA